MVGTARVPGLRRLSLTSFRLRELWRTRRADIEEFHDGLIRPHENSRGSPPKIILDSCFHLDNCGSDNEYLGIHSHQDPRPRTTTRILGLASVGLRTGHASPNDLRRPRSKSDLFSNQKIRSAVCEMNLRLRNTNMRN